MRIIFADYKSKAIEESPQSFPPLVDAIAFLDKLLSQRLAHFGQVLDYAGRVLANRAFIEDEPTSSVISA